MNPKSLLDQIQTLSAERPFTAAVVQGATGVSVAPVTSESNPYFTVYRSEKGAGNGAWSSVEVRSPTSLSAGKGGMVLLHIASPCVKASDVGDRFGAAEPGEPTSPDMPPGSPEYTVYHQPWGALRLGFSPSSECLDTVVLDANG